MSLVSVNYIDHKIPSTYSMHLVNDFKDIFPYDLPTVPPPREIDFCIDLDPILHQFQFLLTEWLQLNSKS